MNKETLLGMLDGMAMDAERALAEGRYVVEVSARELKEMVEGVQQKMRWDDGSE